MKALPYEWIERLSSGSIPAVVDLYLDTAVLVPTFSQRVLQGTPDLRAYFDGFMGDRPGMTGTINTLVSQSAGRSRRGEETRIYSGTYTFHVPTEAGVETVEARYTYVVEHTAHGPRILTHNSSEMPEEG